MLKKSIIALNIIMGLTLTACADKKNTEDSIEGRDYNARSELLTGVQMPNPFEDFTSLEQAEKQAGFELKLPNIPAGYKATNYRVLMNENKMIEIIYKNNNKEICFRKGMLENISGVYKDFPQVESIKFDNIIITLKGVGDKIQLAEWQNNSFLFSIYATEYTENDFSINGGLSKEQMTAMVKDML